MENEATGQETAASCVTPDGAAVGMPQLCVEWYPNLIFWSVIALIAIFYLLSRVALPRIGAVLAERQGTITNDIAAAEELKLKASEAERAYEQALADARTEANRIVEENRAELQEDLDAAIAKADAEIAEKQEESAARIKEIRESAAADAEAVAKETATAIVASFGETPDQGKVDAAVKSKMEERA